MDVITELSLTRELLAAAKQCGSSVQKSIALLELASSCQQLATDILQQRYQPLAHTRFAVSEPKLREIFAPAFADRIVQQWLVNHIEPTLEKRFIDDTYACRKGKGALAAIEKVQRHMRQPHHHYFLQLDIHSYFNSIPREGLATCWHTILHHTPLSAVRRELLRQVGAKIFLYDASRHPYTVSGARALLKHIPPHKQLCFRGATHGIPIGSLTSQMLANFYLHPLDLFIKHELKVKGYVRYMDDLMLMGATPAQLNQWRAAIKTFLANELGLQLHPTKQQLQPVSQGARYLGYRVFAHHCWVLPRTCNTFKQRLAWFNQLLQPSDERVTAPQRGLWSRPEMRAPTLDLALLRNMLATINSYYSLLQHGQHWRLRQQLYHQHFGLLKGFFIPANPGYTHIKLKKCFLPPKY